MQRLLQLWERRGRSQIGLEPLLVVKAEIATTLGLSGSESHASCAFQGIVQLMRCPKPSQREGFHPALHPLQPPMALLGNEFCCVQQK